MHIVEAYIIINIYKQYIINKYKKYTTNMENNLTKEDIDELKELFIYYDKTGSGVVPIDKIRQIIQNSRFIVEGLAMKKLLADIDPENKGYATFDQLLQGVSKKAKESDAKQDLIDAFRLFDKKSTGFVTVSDLTEVITKLNVELGVSESEVSQLVRDADFDGDGKIDYTEFVHMLFEIEQIN